MIYHSPQDTPPLPTDTHIIHAALFRATYPSLGSIVLSALILAGIRLLSLLTIALRLLPSYFPIVLRPWLQPLAVGSAMAVGYLETVTSALSRYALIYTGLTGDPFFPSARRARTLTVAVETADVGRYRRKFKTERMFFCPSLVETLMIWLFSPAYHADLCSVDIDIPIFSADVSVCCAYTFRAKFCLGSRGVGRWCDCPRWAVLRRPRQRCVCHCPLLLLQFLTLLVYI